MISDGMTLSDSMRKYPKVFSDIIMSVISVGEQEGTLGKTFFSF